MKFSSAIEVDLYCNYLRRQYASQHLGKYADTNPTPDDLLSIFSLLLIKERLNSKENSHND